MHSERKYVGPADVDERIECESSEPFASWLAQTNGSLAVTTYQAGKVAFLVGVGNNYRC